MEKALVTYKNKLHHISDFLPYDIVSRDGIVFLKDGSAGVILKVDLPPCSTEMERNMVASAYEAVLLTVPEGVVVQFILTTDQFIDEQLEKYLQQSNPDKGPEFALRFASYRAKFLSKRREFRTGRGIPFRIKRMNAYITVRVPPIEFKVSRVKYILELLTGRTGTEEAIIAEVKNVVNKVVDAETRIKSALEARGISAERVGLSDLRRILGTIFSPYDKLHNVEDISPDYIEMNLPEGQWDGILGSSVKIDEKGFTVENSRFVLYYINALPARKPPIGLFTTENQGEGFAFALIDLFKRAYMCASIYVPPQDKEKGYLNMKRAFARYTGGVTATQIAEDVEHVLKHVFAENKRVVRQTFSFVVDERESGAVESSLAVFGISCAREDIIADLLLQASLPLGYKQGFDEILVRRRRCSSDVAVTFLPTYGTYKGYGNPIVMHVNRRGEPVFIDVFSGPTPHAVVMGATGQGKSVFVVDLLLQYLRTGARVIAVDLGGSYLSLCELCNGRYYKTDLDNPVPVNPLAGFDDVNDKDMIISIMNVLAVMINRGGHLDVYTVNTLHEALVRVRKRMEGNITLDDLYDELVKMGEGDSDTARYARDVAAYLKKYTSYGVYGHFFVTREPFPDEQVIVFDLTGIQDNEDIIRPYLISIFQSVTSMMREYPGKKLFVADEVWKFLSYPVIAESLKTIAKTYRKYGASMITITQEPQDFLDSPAGEAVMAASGNRFYLRMEHEVLMKNKEILGFNDEMMKVLKTLHKVNGVYSEVMVQTGNTFGVIRVLWSPYLRWATVTNEDDRNYLRKLIKEKGSIRAALEELLGREERELEKV